MWRLLFKSATWDAQLILISLSGIGRRIWRYGFHIDKKIHIVKYAGKKSPAKGTALTEPMPWWNYALEMVQEDVRENIKRWNWSWIKSRLDARTVYLDLYKQDLKGEKLSPEDAIKLEAIHREYSYDDLISWRKLANASIEVDKNVPIEKKVASFFNSWFSPKV